MAARKYYTVAAKNGLNMRQDADKGSTVIKVLPYGEKITVDTSAKHYEGWTAVKGGGYVMSKFLE